MTHDPATVWCAGKGNHHELTCTQRTGCVHWRALVDFGREHGGSRTVPPEIRVIGRLCGAKHEHFRARETGP